ncbi:MFS transporter [Mycolicibacterium fortuitum]|uniref:MFS transporter n=1 Tax=Mycolicibacterium fortuitum TaxID=1766 RepID=UPI0007EB4608|nr:MFS transporter [Mycolicibacterium fortuitum]OBB30110.1 MFS transporter [Mycolicibacterium fortuitum]OBB46461.1 MFS transporter [Mycolicibacterium fortuitum]OBB66802.1 MFS transporter [Mycolicibacterium fortuitum]OBF87681.1 MFS transporter [Mycolicibacterium fortuitum]OBG16247.1 MFS transporter [Mycolicibacterium fortuitum]
MTTSLERARSVVAPDPTVRTLAVLALAFGGFGIGTTEFVAMGLLPDIATGFRISEPTAGHVISAYALGVVVGAPVIAALTARWPRKALLLSLMAVFTAGNLASMLAPSYPTLVIARFVAGLPHGAFFGIAALAAAHLMGPQNRAKAVAYVLCGLTIATVLGVPLASWLGQALGWRSAFGLVVGVGLITLAAQWRWLPEQLRTMQVSSPLTELGALRRPQVWLAVLVGMIGFGGMFAVYTYISTTMTDVTGLSRSMVPVALMVFGLGMVAGNLIGGRLADSSVVRALYLSLGSLAVLLAAFSLGSHSPWTALPLLFGVGVAGSAVGPALQTRLMDVAHDAQTLAAALNHSALNIGNATGAWVGGLVIAAGLGYTAPAAAGALLAVGGVLAFTVSVALQRRSSTPR